MQFIDRKSELAVLDKEYQRPGASLVILYGRRRVGKTSLLKEFMREKRSLYFLATEESEAMNRQAFQKLLADFLTNDLLQAASITRWEVLFQQLVKASKKERIILTIDEFQYIGRNSPAFLSVFQRCWDTILSQGNLMVILCGSLVSMMLSQTLNYDSPLYGRRTAQMKLRPVAYRYYAEFFPKKMPEDELIKRYSITGGVPKYIESFNDNTSLPEAIRKNILDPASFLFDEPNFLLQKEVTEIGSYFSILRVIAAGNHKVSKIAAVLQQKQTNIPRYLKVLIDLDLVEREIPVTEHNAEKSKKGLYQIKDNFIRFWFQFVYPYISYVEMGHLELVMSRIDKNFIDTQVSFVYEKICQEKLWELSAQGRLPGILEKIGRWWDNQHEIDVVGLSEADNLLVAGECKFWQGPVGINVLQALEKKTAYINWHNEQRQVVYILFSIHGFSQELQELVTIRQDVLLVS